MNETTRRDIIFHARRDFPRESCGLVVVRSGKEIYFPCANLSSDPNNFIMSPKDYAAAEDLGDIVRIIHSHCNVGPEPSQADLVACEVSGLPWSIISIPNETWGECKPSGYHAPLIGRVWVHGVLDCYELVRDWYQAERGVILPHFERSEEWWKKGQNLYVENFQAAGFKVMPEGTQPVIGDGLIMQLGSEVPNHAAIYLGEDLMLHHVQNRLSCREVFGGYWKKNTVAIVRHSST